jgi:hypothetical protein
VSRARSLGPEENQRVVEATRELRALYSTQAALAAALKLPDGSNNSMSQFVVGKALRGEPVGVTFARAVAQLKGTTFEALVSGVPTPSEHAGRRHEDLPGWKLAADELIAQSYAPPYAVRGAGKAFVSFSPAKVNLPYVYDQAMLWLKHASAEVREAAEAEDIDDVLAQEDALDDERRGVVLESGPLRESGIQAPAGAKIGR